MLKHIWLVTMLVGCTTDDTVEDIPPFDPMTAPVARGTTPTLDTLEEYAAKCDAATGIHVPSFSCEDGIKLEGQVKNTQGKCATPNVLYGECDEGAKFLVLAENSEASVVAHCRKHGATTTNGYRDIAIIQSNKVNGATCFYQALPETPGPTGDLPGADVRAPSEGMAAWKWMNPKETWSSGCTNCHDNGAFIRSPYLAQLKTGPWQHVMPSTAQGFNNLTTPLKYVGADFAGSKSWAVTTPADPTCTTCHRLAVNNSGNGGTGGHYARVATDWTQASKFDHGDPAMDPTKSPIWMMPNQKTFLVDSFNRALAIEACAQAFVNNWFWFVPNGCSMTPLADSYTPGITNAFGDDIVALGSSFEGAGIVTAFSRGDGSFVVTNTTAGSFGSLAKQSGVKRVSGDFNKDGRMDLALIGGAGWNTIPVAFSNGDGTYLYTNNSAGPEFNNWARTPNVKALVGDYNKDGYADIALTGAAGWASIPVAFSAGGGNWQITNASSGLAGLASQAGAQPFVGDYNKDGYSDIALVGNAGWAFLPVAFAAGGGNWQLTLQPAPSFNQWASQPSVQVVPGDYNRDGYTDLALTGGVWSSIPVAFSAGGGSFNITNYGIPSFGSWANSPGAKAIAGDFNHDGYTDIALTGVAGWASIPVAISAGNGAFIPTNNSVGSFGAWSSTAGVRQVAGDFNNDGYTDIALTGGWWSSIPVALGTGAGAFVITNSSATYMPSVTTSASTTLAVGRVN